jgi:diguanylate cyclase (GGDEF)-like protein/PAS domain S-box-containing protein
MKPTSRPSWPVFGLPLCVLAAGLATTVLTARPLFQAEADHERAAFEADAQGLAGSLLRHIDLCEQSLRAAALVAATGGPLEASRWQDLANRLGMGSAQSCWRELAFLGMDPAMPPALVAPREETAAALLGFDPTRDTEHRHAIANSLSNGLPAMTGASHWPTLAPGQSAVVWYLPVQTEQAGRAGATAPAGAKDGRDGTAAPGLLGFIAAPLLAEDLLARTHAEFPRWHLRLTEPGVAEPLAVVHPTRERADAAPSATHSRKTTRTLAAGQRQLTLTLALADHVVPPPWQRPGMLALAGGALASLLAALATWALLRSSARAEALARRYSARARAGEARLLGVLDGTREGIFTLDIRANILSVNRAGERLFGYRTEDLLGRPVSDLFDPHFLEAYRQDWMDFVRAARSGGEGAHPSQELEMRHRDGTRVTTRSSLELVRIDDAEVVVWVAGDVTHEREMERVAADAQALSERILDVIPISVMTLDAQLRIRSANRASQAMYGFSEGELNGRALAELHDGEEWQRRAAEVEALQAEAGGGAPAASAASAHEQEWRQRRHDGRTFPAAVTTVPLRVAGTGRGSPHGEAGTLRIAVDITERKRSAARIEHLALHDGLTGLPNRVLLEDRISQAMKRAQRQRQGFALMLMDLDRFKHINDTLGHPVGDEVLKIVAQRLAGAVRSSDTVVRMGGDEFALLLPDIGQPQQATEVARKLLAAMNDLILVDPYRLAVTPSIGIALFPEHGEDLPTLLKNADRAMYDAKARGRNTFSIYGQQMAGRGQQLALEADLRQALERQELRLHYQPVVDCASGEVHGLEALLRWQHPQRGLVPPGDFIPIAEESGLIVPIGAWVMRQACEDLARLHRAGHRGLHMAVNLSPRQFGDEGLIGHVRQALADSGVPGSLLEVEITESALMESVERTGNSLAALRELGLSIAIDDFGTGYSSLSYLARFPVQTIKVDRSFVREIDGGDGVAMLASVIVSMAHGLGMKVVAEGVETETQHMHLADLRCEYLQGWRFGKAVPVEEVPRSIASIRAIAPVDPGAQLQVWAPTQGLWMSHTQI